jgi:SEC-C motif-containing protein
MPAKPNNISRCFCGGDQLYANCCGPYHSKAALPSTAAQLMRSRYSAFVLKKTDYLLVTWHPDTRPIQLNLCEDSRQWFSLKIIATQAGGANDVEGMVEFVAKYKINGRAMRQTERSRFQRLENRWVYVAGDVAR